MSMRILWVLFGLIVFNPAQADMAIRMDQTEVSIRAFAEFVAATGFQTKAELDGGMVYEAGWVVKPGWNWRQPYGTVSPPDEPAVHLTFDEA
ncbi:MAG: SUMF1/EgtB/PvdO family nonheme iron enzyme, partial [Candidatus Puniceispirillaceae bacterium]